MVPGLEKGLPVDGGGRREGSERAGRWGWGRAPEGEEAAPWLRVWGRISRSKPRTKPTKKTAKTEVTSTATIAIKIHTQKSINRTSLKTNAFVLLKTTPELESERHREKLSGSPAPPPRTKPSRGGREHRPSRGEASAGETLSGCGSGNAQTGNSPDVAQQKAEPAGASIQREALGAEVRGAAGVNDLRENSAARSSQAQSRPRHAPCNPTANFPCRNKPDSKVTTGHCPMSGAAEHAEDRA